MNAAPVTEWFQELQLTKPVEVTALRKRVVFGSSKANGATVALVVALPIELPDSIALVSDAMELLVALQTDVSDREDGTLQICGDEQGVVLLSTDQVRQQRGRALYCGTPINFFRIERLDDRGQWVLDNEATITVPLAGLKAVTSE